MSGVLKLLILTKGAILVVAGAKSIQISLRSAATPLRGTRSCDGLAEEQRREIAELHRKSGSRSYLSFAESKFDLG